MVKRVCASAAVGGVAVLSVFLAPVRCANAQAATVASDRTAGYVVFPKVVSDPQGLLHEGRSVDTLIQLTNTATGGIPPNITTGDRVVHCFYVDATSHCTSGTGRLDEETGACNDAADCFGSDTCDPGWSQTDFTIALTANQPEGWEASTGKRLGGQTSDGSGVVIPVPENAFVGELKCVEIDGGPTGGDPKATTDTPINANDLKGEATIYELTSGEPGSVDVRSYNGIGVQTVASNGATQADHVMCLGATTGSAECAVAEYAACPGSLIFNHFFDQRVAGGGVVTDLTLVPCSENLAVPANQTTTAVQFLVFNEFEQRLSASTRFNCFKETQISHIDAAVGQETSSIFNVGVEGTLTGQTRIRPVPGSETNTGHGLLAVAEEFRIVDGSVGSAAFNIDYAAPNQGHGDFVRLP
jgi:hypothetical protein